MSEPKLEPVHLSGGRRANLRPSDWMDNWWVGEGKDEHCAFEGTWKDLANLAAQILSHPNTEKVAPELYQPDLRWYT